MSTASSTAPDTAASSPAVQPSVRRTAAVIAALLATLTAGLLPPARSDGVDMDGVFSLWSRPRRETSPELPTLQLLLLALAVLEWRRWNGRALLYCDEWYARYLDDIGLLKLWDEVDSTTIAGVAAMDIDARSFWTAARLYAVGQASVPFVSLDCDLIAWRCLEPEFAGRGLVFTHWEATDESPWYPRLEELHKPHSYRFDERLDWSVRAANTSVVYFGDTSVRDRYVEDAFRFMVGNPGRTRPNVGVAPELLFAEQRLLPQAALQCGVEPTPLLDATWTPLIDQFVGPDPAARSWDPLRVTTQHAGITHAWFYKSVLADREPRMLRLRADLTRKVRADHPETAEVLARLGAI